MVTQLSECAPSEPAEREAEQAFVKSKIPLLKVIAAELFDGVDVYFVDDPELPQTQNVVFAVRASGAVREIADRRREWYRRTHVALEGRCERVQLQIDLFGS